MVVFTLITIPAGIALALLQAQETDAPWLLTTVTITALLLHACSA